MSDNEGPTKKSGYRLEYANSARAKCKGGFQLALVTTTMPDADFFSSKALSLAQVRKRNMHVHARDA